MANLYDLTTQLIKTTYQRVVQVVWSGVPGSSTPILYDGLGNQLTGLLSVQSIGPSGSVQFAYSGLTSGSANFKYDKDINVLFIDSGITNKNTLVTSSSYTIKQDDHRIRIKYTLTGSVNIILPLISSVGNIEYRIKDEEGNASLNKIHIFTNPSNYIDGQLTQSIDVNYGAISLYNDGISNWYIE